MSKISKDRIEKIKELDALTYFKNYAPDDLVRNGRNESYYLKSHDSLKLSNGMWFWWSKGIGGKSALDYLVKVEGLNFKDAVEYLEDLTTTSPPVKYISRKQNSHFFRIPYKNESNDQIIDYLVNKRHIDLSIIKELIDANLIYEEKLSHNCVFIGVDSFGTPRFACKRSINSNFKQDAFGSNKNYSFNITNKGNIILHVFESAIDLLSYLTILKMNKQDLSNANYLSLSGVGSSSSTSHVLIDYLERHKEIKSIILHLDNDEAGISATENLLTVLKDLYDVHSEEIEYGKDMNDYLIYLKNF